MLPCLSSDSERETLDKTLISSTVEILNLSLQKTTFVQTRPKSTKWMLSCLLSDSQCEAVDKTAISSTVEILNLSLRKKDFRPDLADVDETDVFLPFE